MGTSVTAVMSIFHKAFIDYRNRLESVVVHEIAKASWENYIFMAMTHVELYTTFLACGGLFISLHLQ